MRAPLTPQTLAHWVDERGMPRYRTAQVLRWVYQRRATSAAVMSDVPQPVREALARDFVIPALEAVTLARSVDGTRKLLFRPNGCAPFESVLIPDPPRLTLCVSSQAGCGMGCQFCATARLGLRRNLVSTEIVGQVLAAQRELSADERITNVVFMGMGEPLANYDALVQAITVLLADWGLGFSGRRITVSTVGLIPQLQRLVRETPVSVAVSLGATTNALRDRLMPINRTYPLERLLGACRTLPIAQRRRITFEYVLLAEVNDTDADASRLTRLLHGIRAKVNLIPFNPFTGSGFRPPAPEVVQRFQQRLLAAGVSATLRVGRGGDIQAACGQLAAMAAAGPS